MIVDLRDNTTAQQNDRTLGRMQQGAAASARTGLAVRAYQDRKASAEHALKVESLKADRIRREGIQRNNARGMRAGAEAGVGFDAKGFETMVNDLAESPEYSTQLSHILDGYAGLEFPDAAAAINSPEAGAMFTDVAELYGIQQAQMAGERKATGMERFARVIGDERAGMSPDDVNALMQQAQDAGVSAEEFELELQKKMETAAANVGFFEAKQSVLAEVGPVWDSVRNQFGGEAQGDMPADSIEGILAGQGKQPNVPEVMRLRGQIELAETPEELYRARSNFLVKAYGLDGVITEAEDIAWQSGQRAAKQTFETGKQNALASFDDTKPGPAARIYAETPEVNDMLPAGMREQPDHVQTIYLDMVRAGVDPADPDAADLFLSEERKINPLYGYSPRGAAAQQLKLDGYEDALPQLEALLDAGMPPDEAYKKIANKRIRDESKGRNASALAVAQQARGVISAAVGREVTIEEAQEIVKDNPIFQATSSVGEFGAKGVKVAANTAEKVDQAGRWIAGTFGAINRVIDHFTMDEEDRIRRPDGSIDYAAEDKRRSEQHRADLQQRYDKPKEVSGHDDLSKAWSKTKDPEARDTIRYEAEQREHYGPVVAVVELSEFSKAYAAQSARQFIEARMKDVAPTEGESDGLNERLYFHMFMSEWFPEMEVPQRRKFFELVENGLEVTPDMRDL